MEHKVQVLGFSRVLKDIPSLIKEVNRITGDFCVIQLLNADGIAGKKHILHATQQAILAFEREENIANDLGLEICVRASAQRQISKALKILGLKEGLNKICAVVVDCDDGVETELEKFLGKRDDKYLEADVTILKDMYQVSDEELKNSGNITRAMIERTSLLVLDT